LLSNKAPYSAGSVAIAPDVVPHNILAEAQTGLTKDGHMYGFLGHLGFAALFGLAVKNDSYNGESVTEHPGYRHRILEYQN